MSDDEFGWSPQDDQHLAAATLDASGVKRKLNKDDSDRVPSPKRSRSDLKVHSVQSPNIELANKVLKERFGLDSFRLEQEKAITTILDGGSALVVFPTGGGKSLCYQVSLASYCRGV